MAYILDERRRLRDSGGSGHFEKTVLPHLDAAYNLARWLLRNDSDAQDLVQEACLRAYRFFDGFRGGNAKAWFLTIVRNTCLTWIEENRSRGTSVAFDENLHSPDRAGNEPWAGNPETICLQNLETAALMRGLEQLPMEFREVLILCELEGCSYREISAIVNIPLGTVMSRLSRARAQLGRTLARTETRDGL